MAVRNKAFFTERLNLAYAIVEDLLGHESELSEEDLEAIDSALEQARDNLSQALAEVEAIDE